MKHNIGVIINYCTNDYKFIGPNIRQIIKFSQDIFVTYSDHFYTGQPENQKLLLRTIKENPKARFVDMKYHLVKSPLPELFCRLLPRTGNLRPLYGPHYWACMSRYLGYSQLSKDIKYILFLDADEIVDGAKFKRWLETEDYQQFQSLSFGCYVYFRSPRYQAITIEMCGLLTRNCKIAKSLFLSHNDRWNLYQYLSGAKKSHVVDTNGVPMIHHYAWARTKNEMLNKVATWGHSQERDWKKLVLAEFAHPFNGTDFLRHYKYITVKPFINFSKD